MFQWFVFALNDCQIVKKILNVSFRERSKFRIAQKSGKSP